MRLLLLTPALALCLAACNKDDDTEAQNPARTLTAEAISSNDVTAIDAVTGEAANMAEDVELTLEMNDGADGATASGNGGPTRRRAQGSSPAASPATNSAEPAPEPEAPANLQSNAQ